VNEYLAYGVRNVAVPYPVKWTGKRVECIETGPHITGNPRPQPGVPRHMWVAAETNVSAATSLASVPAGSQVGSHSGSTATVACGHWWKRKPLAEPSQGPGLGDIPAAMASMASPAWSISGGSGSPGRGYPDGDILSWGMWRSLGVASGIRSAEDPPPCTRRGQGRRCLVR
jgi:hypothetical protein